MEKSIPEQWDDLTHWILPDMPTSDLQSPAQFATDNDSFPLTTEYKELDIVVFILAFQLSE